jgi:DNA repair protein RecN (Recombination protein N)
MFEGAQRCGRIRSLRRVGGSHWFETCAAGWDLLLMLTELVIRDLALIESAEVELAPGLNALTGETGTGKSLFVGALECLRGATPRGGAASWVRRDAAQARVEGCFQLSDRGLLERVQACLLEELPELVEEVGGSEAELILGRTLGRDGKTRAHVNQRPVPLRSLAKLAALVLEIHGQNDHQRLVDPAEQVRLFDAFAGLDGLVGEYLRRRAAWMSRKDELENRNARAEERRERAELLRFQRAELREARLASGEHAALLEERECLRGAGELRFQLGGVVHALLESDGAALDRVKTAERTLERWSARLPRLAEALESLRSAEVHLAEAGGLVTSVLDGISDDPARLEAVEARLAELEALARKYRTSEAELGAVLEAVERELDGLEDSGLGANRLAQEVEERRAELELGARELAEGRRAAAPRLEKAIRASLEALGLGNARFEVSFLSRGELDEQRYGPAGVEDLEFLLAANPGEPCLPLARVASYGEAARIMLALRAVLSSGDRGRTLVFDEIDSGVGGRLGPEVGAALRALGEHHQILCVTHLPAIAAVAARHLALTKEVRAGRTRTTLAVLEGEARVAEVADMIAGGADEQTARAEARRLLRAGKT